MENTSNDPHVPVIKANPEDNPITPPKKQKFNTSFIWKNRALAIFVVAFALIGAYVLINSFAATVSYTKVWSTATDWRTGTLSNTSVVGNTVELAPNPTPVTTTTNTTSTTNTTNKTVTTTTPTPATSGATTAATPTTDLAIDRPVSASSTASTNTSGFFGWWNYYFGHTSQYNPPTNAVDGSTTTRWASATSSPQWIYVDLGSTYNISSVKINWYSDYAKAYQVQVSSNASTWTTIYTNSSNTGGINTLTGLSGSGRYVRIYATQPATSNGYSIYELYVYGTAPSTTPTTPSAPTVSFSANPTTVTTTGGQTTLTWSSSGATSCTASGGWTGTEALTGTSNVNVTQSGTYNLACTGTGGTTTKSVTVTYSPPVTTPAVTYVSSGTIVLTFNAGSAVSWAALTPTSTLPAGTGITYQVRTSSNDSSWSGWVSSSAIASQASSQYIQVQATLTTSNSANTPVLTGITLGYNSVVVAPTVTFSANPTSVNQGSNTVSTLTWSSTGTTSCTASGGWTGTEATSGETNVTLTQTTTYNLSCTGAGGSASKSVTVTYVPTTTTPPSGGSGGGTGTPTGPAAGTVLFDDEFNGAAGPFFPGGSLISSDGLWYDDTGCNLNGAACNDVAGNATLNGNGDLDLRISWDSSNNEYDGAFISTFLNSYWPPSQKGSTLLTPPYQITMVAQMPNVSSAWPGLWLEDINHTQAQGVNEIDASEEYGSNTAASCNQHFWVNGAQQVPSDIPAGNTSWGSNGFSCGTSASPSIATSMNTYTVDVYSDHVVYSFGSASATSPHGTLGTDGSIGDQGILLDVNLTSAPPAGQGPWDMLIDSIKVTAL